MTNKFLCAIEIITKYCFNVLLCVWGGVGVIFKNGGLTVVVFTK